MPIEQISSSGQVDYLAPDALGSTRLITGSGGTVVGTASYSPYGQVTSQSGTVSTPFGFAGQYTDSQTGLVYMRALNYADPSGLYEGEGTGGIIDLGVNAAPEPNGVPSEGGGASGAGSTDTCASGLNISEANYAQRTYSPRFGPNGPLNIAQGLVTEVGNELKSGALTPQDLPVNVIEREGNTLILNTRTSQALTQAGIPRELWYVIDQTGNPDFERMLSGQLSRNGLDSTGISTVLPK